MVVMEEAVVEGAAASEDVNLVELMNARARSYGMLARLFREEVDLPTLRELQKMRFPQATGNAAADEGYHQLYDYLKRAWDDSVTELAIDYVSTFIGHGVNGYSAAYPYESIYRTGAKSLGGDHCAEVSDVFRSCMFSPTRDRLIAEDHIACELEFMQYMANSELVALRDGERSVVRGTQERELEFLENHLLSWVESFRNAVEQFAETDFYLGLLEMTQGWLELDAEYLRTQCANEEEDAQ